MHGVACGVRQPCCRASRAHNLARVTSLTRLVTMRQLHSRCFLKQVLVDPAPSLPVWKRGWLPAIASAITC
ncbi:MAG: hypothetical protein D6716_02075 [Chloroflexi bacterium]|nr:MAG: hypothetical protein D6716_02075 [Chloroflexota bacterium]